MMATHHFLFFLTNRIEDRASKYIWIGSENHLRRLTWCEYQEGGVLSDILPILEIRYGHRINVVEISTGMVGLRDILICWRDSNAWLASRYGTLDNHDYMDLI